MSNYKVLDAKRIRAYAIRFYETHYVGVTTIKDEAYYLYGSFGEFVADKAIRHHVTSKLPAQPV